MSSETINFGVRPMQFLDLIGYTRSKRFYGPGQVDDLPANELAFALRLAATECLKLVARTDAVRFEGAYVLQKEPQAPAVPVVYVVRIDSDAAARRVHQFVWNQNQSPFLIVESPSTIRVYPGFAFDRDGDHPLLTVAKGTADALEQLAAFRAESIDDGTLWSQWAHAVDPSRRVDESLLRDLEALDKRLQSEGVGRAASHGLIGKFVYLHYLRDRDILSNKKLENPEWDIDPDHLFTRQATLKAFRNVNEKLQDWLNGSVFSLADADLSDITQAQLRLVAGVFRGDSPVGMDGVQTSLFEAYDFSHIPIETLSCVYEQFLHDSKDEDGGSRGKTLGAYYTPLPLTDYVLAEMERRRPLRTGMKVLDPACGSGAFLVQCYRRLIERQRRDEGRELKTTELRALLTRHIFGIDRDDDACRVAELSLIMTLLDYVQPPDLENTNFKLPSLRGQNIFQGDFFDESGPVHELLDQQRFDWIVGNPPWAEVKKTPAPEHEHFVAHQWMRTHAKSHPTSGNQIAEAFVWKAGEHLAPEGACGLVVLAMTWFKKEATTFRQRFFSERRVWCLANFANLAYVLFAGRSERPASVVFFEREAPDDDHVILTFAPFVAEQVANRRAKPNRRPVTWNIVVSGNELREVDNAVARQGESLTWKLAMWGTSRDRKLLQRLDARFKDQQFDSLKRFDIEEPHEGLQLRKFIVAEIDESNVKLGGNEEETNVEEELEHHPELIGQTKLQFKTLRGVGRIFAFPPSATNEVIGSDECYVRKGRATLSIAASTPPHVIVDASRRFAVFSDEFLAVPPRQIGIAGKAGSEEALRALSLLLSSDFCTYHQFLKSPQWGVDANRADLDALTTLPVPLGQLSAVELSDLANLQRELASASTDQFEPLLRELNDRVYKLLGLRATERWLVEDFVQLHLELNKGKVTAKAMRAPKPAEQQAYLAALRDCLDGFLTVDRGRRHKLEVLVDRDSALLSVSLARSKVAIAPVVLNADEPAARNLQTIRDHLRTKHSQWVYFERGLKVYDPEQDVLYQFKPLQRLHWTRRQAVLDSDDIIAETLSAGVES